MVQFNRCKKCDQVMNDSDATICPRCEGPDPETFPIMLDHETRKELVNILHPRSVPWKFIWQYAKTAVDNHNQTLHRLRQRGGLCPGEICAVIYADTKWWWVAADLAMTRLIEVVDKWEQLPNDLKGDPELGPLGRALDAVVGEEWDQGPETGPSDDS